MQKTILLVEDEKLLSDIFSTALKTAGFRVLTAYNGEDGLNMAIQNQPDLILLDIVLPKMSGLDVLREIRNDAWGANASVIMLTNLEPNSSILEEISKGTPAYYLIKSNTEISETISKIKEVLMI